MNAYILYRGDRRGSHVDFRRKLVVGLCEGFPCAPMFVATSRDTRETSGKAFSDSGGEKEKLHRM